ncbi:MAG: histidinol-phosphate transaminase [Alphaproteobacteria bacterium]|nr:histidinol-phosphate transaminase [Alphaproteobacteria bacterium]
MRNNIQKHLRPHYISQPGYSSAGMEVLKDDEKIFLNANENPYELPGLEGLNRYPQPQPPVLLEAFARNYGTESDYIAITRGADEGISILVKLFCEPRKDKIIVNTPTFGMYAVNAYFMPSDVIDIPLIKKDGSFHLNQDEIIKQATDPNQNVKLVFLCSPNNPTGNSFSHDQISEICEALESQAVVVLDETYAEFAELGSMVDDLASTPNLIILRTLSKSYAFAGVRMGCMLCADTEFVRIFRTKGLDVYPVPRTSIEAAFHVLSPEIQPIAKENIKKLIASREKMKEALEQSDHVTHVYPSNANFLLVEMRDAKGFCDFAAENKVIIRDFSSKPDTKNCLRLTIGTEEENEKVLALLQQFAK